MLRTNRAALLCALLAGPMLASAQTPPMDHSAMPGMDHGRMGHGDVQPRSEGATDGMDHGQMDHSQMKDMDDGQMKGMDHGQMEGMDHGRMKGMDHKAMQQTDRGPKGYTGMVPGGKRTIEGMDHDGMQGMDHGSMNMQGGSPPPDARDPDAYSDGLQLGPLPGKDMADNDPYGQLLLDQFEGYRATNGETGIRLDAQAWYGTDLNKLWLKAETSRANGILGATRLEALYTRAFAPYFGWQAGLRHDVGGGPSRNWAAFGVQGLAPYWFDVEATAYIGEGGRTALRFEAEYDLRITQRIVLQPDAEVAFFGKNDRDRNIGSGLSDAALGLRLRYEITRKFAPYVGVSWGRAFGNTADMLRRAGGEVSETRFVAGIRMWF